MKDEKSQSHGKSHYLCGKRILPKPIGKTTDIVQIIDGMGDYPTFEKELKVEENWYEENFNKFTGVIECINGKLIKIRKK